ncbi:MAG: oligosaccharide flippase family protein, partial [Candidatus Latescibacteria bacterium]|nr:oligosaccharide flippase family protein [Candidatus Latescibacterota bacterium]
MTVPPSRHSIPEQAAPRHDAKVIAKGAGVNLLGTLARTIKSASFILMTRLFGAEVFGLYVLGWSVIDLLSRFSMFGLEKGVMKFAIQHRVDKNEDAVHRTLGEAILVGLIVSAVMTGLSYVVAPVIAVHVFHKPELTRGLRILTFSIPFLTLSHVLLAASKSLKIMRFEAYVKSIAEPLVMFAAAGLCFVIGWRFSGITFAHLAAAAGGTVFALYCFRRLFSLKACVRGMRSVHLWSEMTRFSLPVVCYDLLYILMMRLDALMLGYYLPAVQVGIYGIAVEIALLTKKIRHWFEPIFVPIISELHHQRQMNRLEENFSLVTRWFLTITIPFFFGIVLIGRDLLAVFGPEFTVGGLSLTLLTLSQILYGSMGSGDLLLMMAGHPYLNLMNTALVLVLNFGLGLFLI